MNIRDMLAGMQVYMSKAAWTPKLIYLLSLLSDWPASNRDNAGFATEHQPSKKPTGYLVARWLHLRRNRLIFHGPLKEHVLLIPTTLGSTYVETLLQNGKSYWTRNSFFHGISGSLCQGTSRARESLFWLGEVGGHCSLEAGRNVWYLGDPLGHLLVLS